MTATLPDQDTDTARQILERAQLQPPCENPRGCDRAAEWIVTCTVRPCRCRQTLLACTPCYEQVRKTQDDPTFFVWRCSSCGGLYGPCSARNVQDLDAEPLRPS